MSGLPHACFAHRYLFVFLFVFLMSKRMRSMRSEALHTLSFCFPFFPQQTHAKHAFGSPPHEQRMRVAAKHAYASPDTACG